MAQTPFSPFALQKKGLNHKTNPHPPRDLSQVRFRLGQEVFHLRDRRLRSASGYNKRSNKGSKSTRLVKWQRTAAGIFVPATHAVRAANRPEKLSAEKYNSKNVTTAGPLRNGNAAHHVWHRCKQCNSRWDQDHNSVRNLLNLLCEGHGDGKRDGRRSQAASH